MSGVLRFDELVTQPVVEQEPTNTLEISIEVAGPKETEAKTVRCSLDQRGLIKLSFKEGGQLPVLLEGRFTTMEDVKTALSVWQARRAKEFVLDESVERPHSSEGNASVDAQVSAAVQEGAAPGFAEQLDEVLTETTEEAKPAPAKPKNTRKTSKR